MITILILRNACNFYVKVFVYVEELNIPVYNYLDKLECRCSKCRFRDTIFWQSHLTQNCRRTHKVQLLRNTSRLMSTCNVRVECAQACHNQHLPEKRFNYIFNIRFT